MARGPLTQEDIVRGQRMLMLRNRWGFMQHEIDENHTKIIHVEDGSNKLTGAGLRDSYARAFGVDPRVITEYAEGQLSLDDVVAKSSRPPRASETANENRRAKTKKPVRDRLWLQIVLTEGGAGAEEATRAARKLKFTENDSPSEVVQSAKRYIQGATANSGAKRAHNSRTHKFHAPK